MDLGPLVPASHNTLREIQPSSALDLSRPPGIGAYPVPPFQESPIGESLRVLIKRKWVVIVSLVTVFSVVAIASLKMMPVYEAGGTIEINKPDATLNFQN